MTILDYLILALMAALLVVGQLLIINGNLNFLLTIMVIEIILILYCFMSHEPIEKTKTDNDER